MLAGRTWNTAAEDKYEAVSEKIMDAIDKGDLKTLRRSVRKTNVDRDLLGCGLKTITGLDLATTKGDAEIIKFYLERGANPEKALAKLNKKLESAERNGYVVETKKLKELLALFSRER